MEVIEGLGVSLAGVEIYMRGTSRGPGVTDPVRLPRIASIAMTLG